MTHATARLIMPVTPERDHIEGNINAPVTLVEYGDFECPYCAAAFPIVKGIQRRMGNRMAFAFRHFPLTTIHPHAEMAAEAAEAAGAQGKFWDMHDRLFLIQPNLSLATIRLEAEAIPDLDLERFDQEVQSHAHHDHIREDFLSGVESGVNGTPTFFINGTRYDGSWEAESLIGALERAMPQQ